MLTIAQNLITTPPPYGFEEGDAVSFNIVISNNGPLDAFDIRLSDLLPGQLSGYNLVSVIYDGVDVSSQFELVGNQLQTRADANLDIAVGKQLTLVLSGVVNASATNFAQLTNQAEVEWTSLNGNLGTAADPAGERTGADGLPASQPGAQRLPRHQPVTDPHRQRHPHLPGRRRG
ncbi:DUF11 domain-containing protein [Aeromonas rivipollensis]|uniref:DUF11 domain-containing protein n=1 Tax=Aeromonas rivipollensis TaxID=948519 RepID=UPI001F289484|nr:DUF11 domain-containing protein [Aeromonas rivipollensis]MCE9943709.1 DUF11 domain-containing protein [Aeromonas rivipollensis]